jgi:hypothetical protein
MKLEIKHLAPYLPYGINVQWIREDDKELIIQDLTISDYNFLIRRKYAKPILKTISELDNLIKNEFKKYDRIKECDMEIINLFCYENTNANEPLVDLDLNKLPYECVEYIFKNHYDFFGLIDAGLAIDINTLNI